MAIHEKHYSSQATPNTVSGDRTPDERGFAGVVGQSGKPAIDYEFQLAQDVRDRLRELVQRHGVSSGFLKGQGRKESYADYSFDAVTAPGFTPDAFHMSKQIALVAGYPVIVEYTDTFTPGDNLLQLDPAPVLGGAPPDVRRTDFIFLEVWLALVGASLHAQATITVATVPAPGDTVTINGNLLTAVVGPAGIDQFTIGANQSLTAQNMLVAVNDPLNSYAVDVAAKLGGTGGDVCILTAQVPGVAGNLLTLASGVPLVLVPSGPLFTGGADRPNKPTQNTLYHHGNVLSPSAVDLPDDIMDPVLLMESAQRVQIQYRIRVTGQAEAVNHKLEPEGFSNTNILAQGGQATPQAGYFFVPADTTSVLGSSSAVAYGIEDGGLWVAGDGTAGSAVALQSLDGYVYGVQIAQIFRRNDAYLGGVGIGFDPVNNSNGGVPSTHPGFVNPAIGAIAAGTSDRPDDAFSDAINENDVLDLRRHVCPDGHDLQSQLQWQLKSLLDGNFRTWAINMGDKQTLGSGSGDVSVRPMACNEVGREQGKGGNGVTSGDTGRGVTIRSLDHVARRFGDQSVVEKLVLPLYSQDREVGPVAPPGTVNPGKYVIKAGGAPGNAGWFEGDTCHIDLDALNASTDGTWDPATASLIAPDESVFDFVPPGTTITDVLSVYHDDGDYTALVDQRVQVTTVVGIGSGHVALTLDQNPTPVTGGVVGAPYPMVGDVFDDGSPRRLFVELEVTYPRGVGLTDTPDHPLTPDSTNYGWGPMVENDVGQRPADMEVPLAPLFREGFRESSLEYLASDNGAGAPITDFFVSRNQTTLAFLRRVYGSAVLLVGVTDIPAAAPALVDVVTTEYGSSSRLVRLGAPLSGAGHTLCSATYFAQDAIPNYGVLGGGYQVSIYYRTNAPQTAGVKDGIIHGGGGPLPTTLEVEPLLMGNDVWTCQAGVGSTDLPFPYAVPSDQIPVNDDSTGTFPGEWYFCATSRISIDSFDAETGVLNLQALIPADETIDFSFGGAVHPPVKDLEFRALYPFADDTVYRPTSIAQPLSGAVRHKVFNAFLARSTTDSLMFRRGELLLIVLSRWAELDADNIVRFTDTNNRTCAAVYRTRGLLLTTL